MSFSNGSQGSRVLSLHTINSNVRNTEYAVRGEVARTGERYRAQLQGSDSVSLPFDSVIFANIGNPQELGQKPITFFRQVLSLLENPQLLDNSDLLITNFGYKPDSVARAKALLGHVKSVGAYSASQGVLAIRQSVAKFIERRDGNPSSPEDIYLCAGASAGVNALLQIICASPKVGVLVPIPQYPLYTATLSLLNATCVPYYLDESSNWSTKQSAIVDALAKARETGIDVRAIVVINPGNPTGACLSAADIDAILKLAAKDACFKKRLSALQQTGGDDRLKTLELASLHSVSKGMVGECGHRGGFMEIVGFHQEVVAQMCKLVSITLCPPVIGQCLVELMVNPPTPGEPSYKVYQKEYDAIFIALHTRALALHKAFITMEGVSCQPPQGSMYLFPEIKLGPKAVQAAAKAGRKPDEFYTLELLDATGICVVPGSGFGQKEGSWHFRTTFLPAGVDWIERFITFHSRFMQTYS